VGINKDEQRERTPARRSTRQSLSEAVDRRPPAPPPSPTFVAAPRESFRDLGEFMASGYFRSMVVKPDSAGGGTFTIKGVLEVRSTSVRVYMHGAVAALEMLPSVIDEVLWRGQWRKDTFGEPAPRDR